MPTGGFRQKVLRLISVRGYGSAERRHHRKMKYCSNTSNALYWKNKDGSDASQHKSTRALQNDRGRKSFCVCCAHNCYLAPHEMWSESERSDLFLIDALVALFTISVWCCAAQQRGENTLDLLLYLKEHCRDFTCQSFTDSRRRSDCTACGNMCERFMSANSVRNHKVKVLLSSLIGLLTQICAIMHKKY